MVGQPAVRLLLQTQKVRNDPPAIGAGGFSYFVKVRMITYLRYIFTEKVSHTPNTWGSGNPQEYLTLTYKASKPLLEAFRVLGKRVHIDNIEYILTY